VAEIGPGYHPDTPAADYAENGGKQSFTPAECQLLDGLHEQAFNHLGNRIYAIALEGDGGYDLGAGAEEDTGGV